LRPGKTFGKKLQQNISSGRLSPTPLNLPPGDRISVSGSRASAAREKAAGGAQGDESMQIDEIVERLENEVSPSEIFAALFELELSGKIKQLPERIL